MSALSDHVDDYLRLRRALGFKLERAGYLLPRFAAFLDAAAATTVTVDLAVSWARKGSSPLSIAKRLNAVRGFAHYLQAIDPATEIPPPGLMPSREQRRSPYIWTPEEVTRLLDAARRMRRPLPAATFETLFGLLAATGMRLGETVALARSDVDLDIGVITLRHTKFDRVRLVPLHPTVTAAMRRYATTRDRTRPAPQVDRFFITTRGSALQSCHVDTTFDRVATAAGLRTTTSHPRLHDLRHTLAVRTLIDWQRDGDDVAARLPLLSGYLGHVNPAHTYWYLTAVPELMQAAAVRLDQRTASTP